MAPDPLAKWVVGQGGLRYRHDFLVFAELKPGPEPCLASTQVEFLEAGLLGQSPRDPDHVGEG
jgi:hypothetical protein